ncbi:hypothetical protein J4G08_20095 [Candidatus Poribacteria bacterium]|nr:hypothetical protein [Candidatus Poribacteria bacterium]
MKRYLYILLLICACVIVLGCQSKAFQMLIEPQEWENLSVADGVTCTAPEMIDGNLKTVGYAKGRWIHLTLLTRKTIHRIIIRGTNITDAILYKQLEGDGRWQAILEVHNNRGNAIEMRRSIVAQSLRIFVGGTSEDKRRVPQYSHLHGGIVQRKALSKPFAQEIEVYGLISKDKK